ncbi:hypothetical protein RCL1_002763 [Eukaryota sp. TZLM3-RCL]
MSTHRFGQPEIIDDETLHFMEEQDDELARLSLKVNRIHSATHSIRSDVEQHLSITDRLVNTFHTARSSVTSSAQKLTTTMRTGSRKHCLILIGVLVLLFLLVRWIFFSKSD